jgi:hypothetical protein
MYGVELWEFEEAMKEINKYTDDSARTYKGYQDT